MILVGNKADLSNSARRVKQEEAQQQAEAWNIPYLETSAKTYMNVDEAFFKLLLDIHHKKKSQQQQSAGKSKKSKKKKKCCIL